MFQPQLHGMISEERHKDFVRQAENDRLANLASTGQPSEFRKTFASIGNKLIRWGSHFRKRYGDSTIGAPTIANHAR
jgi:hypothetical protein